MRLGMVSRARPVQSTTNREAIMEQVQPSLLPFTRQALSALAGTVAISQNTWGTKNLSFENKKEAW